MTFLFLDALGVTNKEAVLRLQSQFLGTLKSYSNYQYKTQPRRCLKVLKLYNDK